MIAYTVVTKLLVYPTELSAYVGRDLLFAALIDFAVQTAVIWAVCFLSSKTDKTFFELLENTFGNVTARIIFGLFALFFILATIVPLFEQDLYVHSTFYDTVPSLIVFLPFFIFAVYAGTKGFRNIGRCADLCLPIFALSVGFIFLMSYGEIKWDNLMPILTTPAADIFNVSLRSVFRFIEPCWMLMFLGHFKYRKGDALKITLSYAFGALIVILFLAGFYGIYGAITPSRQFAISKTSLFFSAIETVGRVDLIMLFILEIVMLFAVVLNIQLAVYTLSKCTGYKNKPVLSVIVNFVLAAILIVFEHSFDAIHNVFISWIWIVFIVFAVVMPPLGWVLKRRKNEAKN